MPSGIGRTDAAGTAICSANAPTIIVHITRSPTRGDVTPSPTAVTTPANSLPGVNGGGTESWYSFDTISAWGQLSAAAMTSTTTSPAPGVGAGTSSTTRSSSAPWCRQRTALTRVRSLAGEARRAPLEERDRAFLGVLAVEDLHERRAIGPRRLDPRLYTRAHEALRGPDRERPVLGDRRRDRDGGVEHLGARHDAIHEPELVRARRLDGVTGEHELQRDREAKPRTQRRAAAAGDQAPLHLRDSELRVLGRDHQIAPHEQLEAARDRGAVHRGDDRQRIVLPDRTSVTTGHVGRALLRHL